MYSTYLPTYLSVLYRWHSQLDVQFMEVDNGSVDKIPVPAIRAKPNALFIPPHPSANPCSFHNCRSIHAPIELCAIDGVKRRTGPSIGQPMPQSFFTRSSLGGGSVAFVGGRACALHRIDRRSRTIASSASQSPEPLLL